ncbi:MAG: signal recognition particle protein [Caulobacteraceae bacterium]
MFEGLTDRLSGVFDRLAGRGVLSEKDIEEAMREVRVALLEADVALPVVKRFIDEARKEASGEAVIRSVKPADQVVKIVYEGLVAMLGGEQAPEPLRLSLNPPTVVLVAGLQGSGKTTLCGKLALRLIRTERKKVLLASLDVRRPAAMEQLEKLARDAGAESLPIVPGQAPADIARRALSAARLSAFDVVVLDTAGRTTIDEAMMSEAAHIAAVSNPSETLLVADSLTGQDAVKTAKAFHERLPLTGLVLTRTDGDARGGAALSMREVTGLPIKFLSSGESLEALDIFDARRVAGRILGHGDVVALVEKAAQELDQAKAEAMARKLAKGKFDLDDLSDQLAQMQRMGGVEGLMGLLPGIQKIKRQMNEAGVSDTILKRQRAIISSMTLKERKKPDILGASRKRRVAAGSGVEVSEVNRLLKQHRQMQDAFKMLARDGGRGFSKLAGLFGAGGMERMAQFGGAPPPAAPGVAPGVPPRLPGLGGSTLAGLKPGALPGLPGAPLDPDRKFRP